MKVLSVRNANEGLPEALRYLREEGVWRDSRNGRVRLAPQPVCIVYQRPMEKVVSWALRDANPFFHLIESMWMLGGMNTVEPLRKYVKTIGQFSDDGETFHGAYGDRWRHMFGVDQILRIANILRTHPDDRRCVMQMWSASDDLGQQGKDFPCNTHIYFSRDDKGRLDMMVCNRSNDLIWGAMGANVVHMSFLMEYMAALIGCEIGIYRQMTNNLHAYEELYEKILPLADEADRVMAPSSNYRYPRTYRLSEDLIDNKMWMMDCRMLLDENSSYGYHHKFFTKVMVPVVQAHALYKMGVSKMAIETLDQCVALDWRYACQEWIKRRMKH